jgi:hypothetical protein
MEGSTLYVASDYSYGNPRSAHLIIGILLADMDASPDWPHLVTRVRRKFLPDGRRMSFKALNDQQRRQALVPFLRTAEDLQGVLLSVAIPKTALAAFAGPSFQAKVEPTLPLQGRWSHSLFDRMFLTVQLTVFIIACVHKPHQNVIWITDVDDFTATPQRVSDVAGIASRFCSAYIAHPVGSLAFGTTDLDPGDRFEEDLAAIPDLIAGASAELLACVDTMCAGVPPTIAVPVPPLSAKSNTILEWFCKPRFPLQRVGFRLQYVDGKGFRVGLWNIKEAW